VSPLGLLNVLNYIAVCCRLFYALYVFYLLRFVYVLFTFVYVPFVLFMCCVIRGLIRWPCSPSPHYN